MLSEVRQITLKVTKTSPRSRSSWPEGPNSKPIAVVRACNADYGKNSTVVDCVHARPVSVSVPANVKK